MLHSLRHASGRAPPTLAIAHSQLPFHVGDPIGAEDLIFVEEVRESIVSSEDTEHDAEPGAHEDEFNVTSEKAEFHCVLSNAHCCMRLCSSRAVAVNQLHVPENESQKATLHDVLLDRNCG